MNTPTWKRLVLRLLRIEPEVRFVDKAHTEQWILQLTWRGVITHRYRVRGYGTHVEFVDEARGGKTAISGRDSVWTCVLPDEVMRAGHLPPLSDDYESDADPWVPLG